MKEKSLLIYKDDNKKILQTRSAPARPEGGEDKITEINPMKSILLSVIILSITGCYLAEPRDPGISTTPTKKQVKYMWSQVGKDMTTEEVISILGDPTAIQNSEDVESWKYEYDITRTYGIVGIRRADGRVWFLSKPSF